MSSQKQDLEAIRKEAARKGWRVDRNKGYWKMWCPTWCGKHMKTMKLTPSNPRYVQNLLGQLGRVTCWNQEPPQDHHQEDAK